jgi:hypothetical protein
MLSTGYAQAMVEERECVTRPERELERLDDVIREINAFNDATKRFVESSAKNMIIDHRDEITPLFKFIGAMECYLIDSAKRRAGLIMEIERRAALEPPVEHPYPFFSVEESGDSYCVGFLAPDGTWFTVNKDVSREQAERAARTYNGKFRAQEGAHESGVIGQATGKTINS